MNFSQNIIQERDLTDYEQALELIGVKEFKFDFKNMCKNGKIKLYIDEIKIDSVLQHKEFVFNLSRVKNLKENVLKVFSFTQADTSSFLKIKLIHPSMAVSLPLNMKGSNSEPHIWKCFEIGKLEYDKKVPLLLYGSMWDDEFNGQKIKRFCWGTDLKRDMSNVELKKIPHMIVLGYELVKTESE